MRRQFHCIDYRFFKFIWRTNASGGRISMSFFSKNGAFRRNAPIIHVVRYLQAELLADGIHGIEPLPAEEFDFTLDLLSVFPHLLDLPVGTVSEVSVGGRRLEDRVLQTETLDDGRRAQVEELLMRRAISPSVMPARAAGRCER